MKIVHDISVTSAQSGHGAVAWDLPWASPLTQAAPALVMDFAAGIYGSGGLKSNLASELNLTRSSAASYINSSGALASASIDQPRITHDPSSLAPQGLLLEPARTNLIVNSDTPAGQVVTVNAAEHFLSFYGSGTVTATGAHVGTYDGAAAFPDQTLVSFTPTAGDLTLSFSGDVTAPQLEEGASASSYFATSGVAGTRDDDDPSIALGAWYSQTSGTLVFSGTLLYAAANDRLIEMEAGDTSTRLSILWNSVLGKPQFQVWNAGTLQAAIAPSGNSIALGDPFRVAISYAADDFAISMNGSAAATDTLGTLPTPINTLRLGRSIWGAQGLTLAESVLYYPARLADAELQALSA